MIEALIQICYHVRKAPSIYIRNCVSQTQRVTMGILSTVKAEPTDPVRGILNDMIDVVGFPRPEEALGTPADITHSLGLPTVRDALPMPADTWARVTRGMRGNAMFPRMPRLPSPDSFFPMPGEASREADVGEAEATADFGGPASFSPFRQRYYQKPPTPPPLPPLP
jgi:hypothetical protein